MILSPELAKIYGIAEREFDENAVKRDAGKFSKVRGKAAGDEGELKGHGFAPHKNRTVDGLLTKMVELGIVEHGNRKQMLSHLKDQYHRQKAKGFPEAKLFKAAFQHVKGTGETGGAGEAAGTPTTAKPLLPRIGAGGKPALQSRPGSSSTSGGGLLQKAARGADTILKKGAELGGQLRPRLVAGAQEAGRLAGKAVGWAQQNIKSTQSGHQEEISNRAFAASAALKGTKGSKDRMAAHAQAHAAHKKAAQVAMYYGDKDTAKQHAQLANKHAGFYKEHKNFIGKQQSRKEGLAGAIAGARGAVGKAFASKEGLAKQAPASSPEKPKASGTGENAFIPDSWKPKRKNTMIPRSWQKEEEDFINSLAEGGYDESKRKRDTGGKFTSGASALKRSQAAHALSKTAKTEDEHRNAQIAHRKAGDALEDHGSALRNAGKTEEAKGVWKQAAEHRRKMFDHYTEARSLYNQSRIRGKKETKESLSLPANLSEDVRKIYESK